jgi:hypothetical protein
VKKEIKPPHWGGKLFLKMFNRRKKGGGITSYCFMELLSYAHLYSFLKD